jgi:hypothetical protein
MCANKNIWMILSTGTGKQNRLFFFVILGVELRPWAWPAILLFVLCNWDYRYAPPHPAIDWNGVLRIFAQAGL